MTRAMRHRSTLTILVFVACLGVAEGARAQGSSGERRVELVDAGQSPQRPLRHRFTAGQRQSLSLRIQTQMQIRMGDRDASVPVPITSLELALGPTEVTSADHLRYEFRVTDLSVDGGEEEAREQIRQALSGLVGTSGTAEVDDRGRTVRFDYELPESIPPQLRQQAQSLRNALTELLPRFPREPVGVGAVWRIRDTLRMPQMSVEIATMYRLRRWEGDRVELQVRIESGEGGELPEGVQMDVGGSGRQRFVVGTLESRTRVQSTAEVVMTGPRGQMQIRMRTRTQVQPTD
jgi:hypothetical protein